MSHVQRPGSRLRSLFFRLLMLRKPQRLHGMPVWMPLSTAAEKAVILRRLDDGLGLLKNHSPARYGRVLRSCRGLLILGADSLRASFNPEQVVCQIGEKFLLAADTTLPAVASTITHEATHGWLFSLGIGYDEPIRHRVEQICIRAALRVAQKLPGAEDEIDRCRRQLTLAADTFSDAGLDRMNAQRLRDLGCPEWLIRLTFRLVRKRTA